MANIKIAEFKGIARQYAPQMQAAADLITAQSVAIGAVSAKSNALNTATRLVRVLAEADCTISIGTNPTATATNHIALSASQYDYFAVQGGEEIAVIQRMVS